MEIEVPVRPVEVVEVHQAAPEVVVENVKEEPQPILQAASSQAAVEEQPEIRPESECM